MQAYITASTIEVPVGFVKYTWFNNVGLNYDF